MEILVAPVSGGRFVNQLAGFYELSKYNYKPDISLGASGGVVATSLYMSASYDTKNLERVSRLCDSSIFVRSWSPPYLDFIPSYAIGVFQGSLYRHSTSYKERLKEIITPGILKDNELWILVFNNSTSCADLYCTTSFERAKLQNNSTEQRLTRASNLKYLNGNIDKYCLVSIASASIPALVPAVEIDGQYCCDGGNLYASPFIPMREQLAEQLKGQEFHIIYNNGCNIDQATFIPDLNQKTIIDTTREATTTVIRSHIIHDRYACYSFLKSMYPEAHLEYEEPTLNEYFEKRKSCLCSLLEIYPCKDKNLQIIDFSGNDTCDAMLTQTQHLRYRMWYVPKISS